MKNKKLFFSVILTLIFSLFCFVSCTSGTVGGTSEKESESITGESPSVESESEIGGESESVGSSVTIPTFAIDEITATPNSLSFTYTETDPDDVGEITEIRAEASGKDTVYAENLEDCEVKGLYSVTTYTLVVEYTYDVGDGEVSKEYKKNKNTLSFKKPTVELTVESTEFDSINFELDINDPDQIANITEIKLVPEEGDEIILEDLSLRVFEGIESGIYTLEVYYEYDLNRGSGPIESVIRKTVSTKIDPLSVVDFVVEVEEGRDPIVLQLSDTQIIDAAQSRPGREQSSYYGIDKLEDRLLVYLRETVTAVNPDLILLTGDVVYGEFDDKGTSLIKLIEAMDSFEIPWAPVFGNHDNESKMGADWQCEQFVKSEYCLFKQRTLTGNGNYTVGISQGGKLTRVFFMMDSNGCGNVSAESLANGHTTSSVGFGLDQVNWFVSIGQIINTWSPETKISFAFHIQIAMFETAYAKYGFTNSDTINNPINIETHENYADTDFGYIGRDLKGPWDHTNTIYNKMKEIGVDSIFVGHEHCNSASVVYDGVRFQFGQKISTYDRCNWLKDDGTIVGAYPIVANATPIMGGTVNVLSSDGAIKGGYIYYCGGGNPLAPKVDEPDGDIVVNGIGLSNGLSHETAVSVEPVTFGGHNAYKCTAVAQGKVKIDPPLVDNAQTLSFTIYVPSSSSTKLGGMGEYAIRVKPNAQEPVYDDNHGDGYIDFDSSATADNLKVVFDQWVTVTIDVSTYNPSSGETQEFAFVIAVGNVIYLRDITVA